MNKTVAKLISVLNNEIGYLEKKSNSNLDNKTANAGRKNYTKYARDMAAIGYGNYQAQPWCDTLTDWALVQTVGVDKAKELLGGWSAYTPTSANYYKKMNRWFSSPEVGDQIFFHNSTRICHTGWVVEVANGYQYTVEGNTSNASGVVANGGGVQKKKYRIGDPSISGYGRPNWASVQEATLDTVREKLQQAVGITEGDATLDDVREELQKALGTTPTVITPPAATPVVTPAKTIIAIGQEHANNFAQCGLDCDGKRGPNTVKGGVRVLQRAMNLDYAAGLVEDGDFGSKSNKALGKHTVRQGESQMMVTALEILLMLKGYDPNGLELPGIFGGGLKSCVEQYQRDNDLEDDGIAGPKTFKSLIA